MTGPRRSESKPSPKDERIFSDFKATYKGLTPKLIAKPLAQILVGDMTDPSYQQTKETVTKLIEKERTLNPNLNTIFLPLEIQEHNIYLHVRLQHLADTFGVKIGFLEQRTGIYDTDALEDPFAIMSPQSHSHSDTKKE
jgi:hypothetical protein